MERPVAVIFKSNDKLDASTMAMWEVPAVITKIKKRKEKPLELWALIFSAEQMPTGGGFLYGLRNTKLKYLGSFPTPMLTIHTFQV